MNHREVLSADSIDALERGYFKALRERDQLRAALTRCTEFLAANYSDADMPDILPLARAALGGSK